MHRGRNARWRFCAVLDADCIQRVRDARSLVRQRHGERVNESTGIYHRCRGVGSCHAVVGCPSLVTLQSLRGDLREQRRVTRSKSTPERRRRALVGRRRRICRARYRPSRLRRCEERLRGVRARLREELRRIRKGAAACNSIVDRAHGCCDARRNFRVLRGHSFGRCVHSTRHASERAYSYRNFALFIFCDVDESVERNPVDDGVHGFCGFGFRGFREFFE
mmetsp:Transcript_13641/g.31260  ORF Transcript_13641/g.31260 Transcript_13641/m.31260 type:complete len:221 (+) Transcript_13641:533-1195(+)